MISDCQIKTRVICDEQLLRKWYSQNGSDSTENRGCLNTKLGYCITNSTTNSGGNVRCFKCANRRKFDLRVGNLWSICFSFEDSTSFAVLPTQTILAIK